MSESFKVTVTPGGRTFEVVAGESVLDAALHQGVSFSYACRNGVCGACRGRIVEGKVDYGDLQPVGLTEAQAAAGEALLCMARPLTDLVVEAKEVGGGSELPIRKLPVRVAKMERLAEDVMRLLLKLPAGQRLQFLAGQYIDVLLPDGGRRSFSIANPPHDDQFLELHIRRVEGGEFTGHVFEQMQEKDILRIEGPYGNFTLNEDASLPMILIAGGTGFAPIKGIIEHAIEEGVKRPMKLYWGARDEAGLYLDELARSWAAHDNFEYIPVPDSASGQWSGRSGRVHEAVLADVGEAADALKGYEVYVAGPPPLVEAVRVDLSARGLLAQNLYYDSFEFAAR